VRFDFSVVLVFLVVGALFVGAALWLGRLLRPRLPPSPDKAATYECGERPVGGGWINFNPRFYLIALVFIVFDVEIALTYPVAIVVRDWIGAGRGTLAVVEIVLFLAVLAAALAWAWASGNLDWVKETEPVPPPDREDVR
jgi:NADH-quinone oxidoreductase subunit A